MVSLRGSSPAEHANWPCLLPLLDLFVGSAPPGALGLCVVADGPIPDSLSFFVPVRNVRPPPPGLIILIAHRRLLVDVVHSFSQPYQPTLAFTPLRVCLCRSLPPLYTLYETRSVIVHRVSTLTHTQQTQTLLFPRKPKLLDRTSRNQINIERCALQ